jgi:hypothetical protein
MGSDSNEVLAGLRWRAGNHEIVPQPGTARRVRDGEPAQITRPTDYPILAVCLTCHREICCAGWLLGEWYHAEPEPE